MPLPNGLPTPLELKRATVAGASPTSTGEPRYSLPVEVLRRTRELAQGSTRRARRRALALAAQVTYLAVLEPDSGASTQDRLKAADGAARVAGLYTEKVDVTITHALGFKGFSSIIDAAPITTLPDGAKSGG